MKMTSRAFMLSAALAASTRGRNAVSAFAVLGRLRPSSAAGASSFAGKALPAAVAPRSSPVAAFTCADGSRGSRNAMGMMFSNPFKKKEVNYEELEGGAEEAARAALKGEVPSKSEAGHDIATFAGGCFWGLELAFQRVPGVVATSVGYTQGAVEKPTYGEVCSGSTGHTEAVQVYYNPSEVSFEELCGVFFGRINPTQVNGQGGDRGTQYRTGIYPHTKEQSDVALKVVDGLRGNYKQPIATEIEGAKVYWPAELYHQQYLAKGGRNGMAQSAEKGATETIRCYG
ncbi:unnamed protein product [Ectocarpus sp. 13 AM-2016]